MSESVPPYTVTRPFCSESRVALARRYSTLVEAWEVLEPGFVVRDVSGLIVAFHADVERFAVRELSA